MFCYVTKMEKINIFASGLRVWTCLSGRIRVSVEYVIMLMVISLYVLIRQEGQHMNQSLLPYERVKLGKMFQKYKFCHCLASSLFTFFFMHLAQG